MDGCNYCRIKSSVGRKILLIEQIFDFLRPIGSDAALFIVSLIPFIELRGGILLGHGLGMNALRVFLICFAANCLPVPFLILLTRPIFERLKGTRLFGNIIHKIEGKIKKKSDKVLEHKYAAVGLLLFVAIPIPGTGAYTGSLIAALLGMRIRQALPPIILGVFIAGLIMTVASMGLFGALDVLL